MQIDAGVGGGGYCEPLIGVVIFAFGGAGVSAATGVMTVAILLLTKITPKNVAVHNATEVARFARAICNRRGAKTDAEGCRISWK
ncbi:hypothetical protein KIW84_070222 [Lathyrus oleraceus]|uniref:CNNM transmembrane domain-containing protein n=1 Tax=Pisum sativum TaxID=3888 RepID=A0A9D4VGY2_PEA|nr:hypothetical protein KIW84_070222 [Pisum sativum]